jgi:hypothetical protein
VHTNQRFQSCRENLAVLKPGGLAPVGGFFGLDLFPDEADPQLFAVYSFELTATQVLWTKAEERTRSESAPQSRSQLEVLLRHLRPP